jgi:molybdenum cofactor cytidylyltransferase
MIDTELAGLSIVVLAAGFSTRMGRSKSLMTIRGVSLIQRTVAVVARFSPNNIVVVAPPRAARLRAELQGYPVTILANRHRARGLSSSVVLALHATRFSAATMLLPADLGELTAADINRLISRWRSAKRRVTARRLDGRALTPLILPKRLYPAARRLVGDAGLQSLVAALPKEQRMLVDLSSAFRDIDTPHDLAVARRACVRLPQPRRLAGANGKVALKPRRNSR